MAHDVFISHSSKDKSDADAICGILESRKIRCWIAPRDVQPGSDFAAAIVDAISDSHIMVLVFSSQSNMSKHVYREVGTAVSKGITIIPFRIEDVQMSKRMEFFLGTTHWLDALSPPLENHIKRLAETIKGILQQPPEPEPEHTNNSINLSSNRKDITNMTGEASDKKKIKKVWVWSIGSIILIVIIVSIYFVYRAGRTSQFEQSIVTAYKSGNYSIARKNASKLMEKNPDIGLSYVILGNIHLMEGDLRTAESYYKKGILAGRITNDQHAEILMGLGRIASIRGNNDEAMQYYRKSSNLAPGTDRAYVSQAILLDRLGKYDQALDMFNKAREVSPTSQGYASMAKEIEKKVALKNDQEKQKQIDALVKDLLENMKKQKTAAPRDGWTSLPLTMWITDLETKGYSLQEGKEQLIESCIADNLISNSRARIVERSLLDKLLKELKLGSSRLADQSMALSLGKIMAARLILSGKVYYTGPTTQITIRLIETETGQVTGAINEEFKSDTAASEIAGKLAVLLLKKLKALYPLRGIISGVDDNSVTINIGQNSGVQQGQRFRVKDTDRILEIDTVQAKTCTVKQMGDKVALSKGLLVEQIFSPH